MCSSTHALAFLFNLRCDSSQFYALTKEIEKKEPVGGRESLVKSRVLLHRVGRVWKCLTKPFSGKLGPRLSSVIFVASKWNVNFVDTVWRHGLTGFT